MKFGMQTLRGIMKDYSTGEIKYSQRYRGLIGNSMDLRNFPFDSDVVSVNLGPKFYKEEKLIFEHDPDFKASETSVIYTMEEWQITAPASVDFKTGKLGHRNVALNVIVHRNSGYYIWKVLLINLLAGMFSWSVFLLPAHEVADRFNITLTLFLARAELGPKPRRCKVLGDVIHPHAVPHLCRTRRAAQVVSKAGSKRKEALPSS